jgi:site-specific recombinase XerD
MIIQTEEYQKIHGEYHEFITAQNYATGNGLMYQACVKEYLCWMESNGICNVINIQSKDTIAYIEYLQKRSNRRGGILSNATIIHNLFALKLLFDYLLDTNRIERALMLPKYNRAKGNEREVLTVDEIKMLYDACETKRDSCLLSIAYGCGLRRTEIQDLNVSDIQLSTGMLIVREGKGKKRRDIPMCDAVIRDIKSYLLHERESYMKRDQPRTEEAFFLNSFGKRLAGNYMNTRLQFLVEKTNNDALTEKEITLHCLRHSISTHLIDSGASMEFVRTFLGHSEIDTVHIYSRRRKRKNIYS